MILYANIKIFNTEPPFKHALYPSKSGQI